MSSLSKPRNRRAPTPAQAKAAQTAPTRAKRYPTLDALLSDVDPPLPPAKRARREARKAWARSALAKLKTFEEWQATSTAAQVSEVNAVFGSNESFYAKLVDELERESVTPSPSEVHFFPDRSVTGVW